MTEQTPFQKLADALAALDALRREYVARFETPVESRDGEWERDTCSLENRKRDAEQLALNIARALVAAGDAGRELAAVKALIAWQEDRCGVVLPHNGGLRAYLLINTVEDDEIVTVHESRGTATTAVELCAKLGVKV